MLKINKVVSYLTFIIKEIYDYVSLKSPEGVLILNIKKQKNELNKLKEKNAKINLMIK